jgi:beta-lysine 5,6-aminomutase alpha subunit
MGAELVLRPGGLVERRADETLGRALALLEEVARDGLMPAIARARFGDVARAEDGGKGLAGVVERAPGYFNPLVELLEARAGGGDDADPDDGGFGPGRPVDAGVEGLAL